VEAEIPAMYAELVDEFRPLASALGMAELLHHAGMWDAPPLEVWPQVEAAIGDEEAAAAAAA
jgi:hypothetical protein